MFVTKARYDREVAQLKADLAASDAVITLHQRLADTDRRRYDELLEKYHSLRVTGANTPEEPRVAPTPDRIALAISRKAGKHQQLRSHLAQFADAKRRQNLPDEEIERLIDEGEDATLAGVPG